MLQLVRQLFRQNFKKIITAIDAHPDIQADHSAKKDKDDIPEPEKKNQDSQQEPKRTPYRLPSLIFPKIIQGLKQMFPEVSFRHKCHLSLIILRAAHLLTGHP
jgi:hypothetical protein